MKKKTTLVALIAGLTLMLAGGAALAGPATPRSNSWDAMHDSPIMQQMRAQMTPDQQGACDQMHERMSSWYTQHPDAPGGPGNMMNGNGMMGSSVSSNRGMMSF